MTDLANLYNAQGDYPKAEVLYARALAIREKVLGPDHPTTASSLSNLALVHSAQNEYGKAEPLYLRALAIREKILGPNSPQTANSLNSLGALYMHQGKYEKAEPLYFKALATWEKIEGPEHRGTATVLHNLASMYTAEGALETAEPLYRRSLAIWEKVLGAEHPKTLNGRGALIVLQCARGQWDLAAATFPAYLGNLRHRHDLAFGRDSEKRSVLLEREYLLSVLHMGASLPQYRAAYLPMFLQTALASKARLTDETSAALEAMKRRVGAEDRKLLAGWQDVGARLSFLTQSGPGSRSAADFHKDVADLEGEESDLAAKIALRSADFRTLTADPTPGKVAAVLGSRVLVEILRVNRFEPVAGARAFMGDALYTAVALFGDGRIAMADLGNAKEIEALVHAYRRAQEVVDNSEQVDALARKLGGMVIAPISKMAGNAREWYLASDGDLRLIPVGAMRLSDGKYVAESYKIWSLGSGRDLLSLGNKIESGVDDLILANPDFGIGNGGFISLPETEDEAEAINKYLPNAQVLDEADRTKQYLLGMPNAPRILHLATHAFYRRGSGDATLRSGIALNGANAGPDGILTAKAAQTLRLRGTQLVVMSACETGVGEVSFGDGLVGLQRSLMLAGAKSQMLTQWPVNSVHTRDFMSRFYGKLAAGATKGDAWIETQRELIRADVPAHFWAPFVLYGDPGLLNEK